MYSVRWICTGQQLKVFTIVTELVERATSVHNALSAQLSPYIYTDYLASQLHMVVKGSPGAEPLSTGSTRRKNNGQCGTQQTCDHTLSTPV